MQNGQSAQRHSKHIAGASAAEHTKEHSLDVVSPKTEDVHATGADEAAAPPAMGGVEAAAAAAVTV